MGVDNNQDKKLRELSSFVSDNIMERNITKYHKLLLEQLNNGVLPPLKNKVNFRFAPPLIGNQHLLLIVNNGEGVLDSRQNEGKNDGLIVEFFWKEGEVVKPEEIKEILNALKIAISVIPEYVFALDKEYMIVHGREGIADVQLCFLTPKNMAYLFPQSGEPVKESNSYILGMQRMDKLAPGFINTLQLIENYCFSNVPKDFYYELSDLICDAAIGVNVIIMDETQKFFSLYRKICNELYQKIDNSRRKYFNIKGVSNLINEMEIDQISLDMLEIKKKKLPRRRVKLSVVGEGGHGKTCLIRALSGKPFKNTLSTHSVERKDFRFPFSSNHLQLQNNDWNKVNEEQIQQSVIGSIHPRSKPVSLYNRFYSAEFGHLLDLEDYHDIVKDELNLLEIKLPNISDDTFDNIENQNPGNGNIISEDSVKLTSNKEQVIEGNEQPITPEKIQKETDFMNKVTKFAKANEEGIYVSVWDFAGQETYFSSHRFLFTESHSVFLLVVNLKEWSETIKKKTHWWYKCVLLHSPHVIVVATRADLFDTVEELLISMRLLTDSFKNMNSPLAFCLVNLPAEIKANNSEIIFGDSTQNNSHWQMRIESLYQSLLLTEKGDWKIGIEETRKYLSKELHSQVDKKEIPALWLYYEHEIMERSKITPVIERSELISLGKDCYLEEEDCNKALKYFSDLGEILLYEKSLNKGVGAYIEKKCAKELENMVVINSHWLIDCFKTIVIRSDLNYELKAPDVLINLDNKTKNLLKEGIITKEYIQYIYNSPLGSKLQHSDVDKIIALLGHYNIIYKHESQQEYFHAPYLMPEEGLPFKHDQDQSYLGISDNYVSLKHFPNLLTMGTATDLIVCSLQWADSENGRLQHHPWRNGVWWKKGNHSFQVKIIPENDSMEIEVFGPNSLKEANNVIILLQKYVLCPPFLLYANEESVDRALHKLLSNLEIPIETQDRIRGIIGGIKTLFKQEKPIDFIISGSYSRDTALYPLHDVDLIVVLPEGFRGSRKPHDVLKKVCKLVDGKEFSFNLKDEILKKIVRPRMQTRSIGFDIDEISFDIVPAFKKSDDDGGTYVIPDNNSGT